MTFWSHVPIFIASTTLMIGVYAAFVGLFFFTYGKHTEQLVVKNEIDHLLDDFTDDFVFFARESDPDLLEQIRKQIDSIKPPDLTEADKEVEKSNAALVKEAAIILSITLGVGIILSLITWRFSLRSKYAYSEIVRRVVFLMIIVMLVEFFFFTFVAGNYHPVDPNAVKKLIVESLRNYAGNN